MTWEFEQCSLLFVQKHFLYELQVSHRFDHSDRIKFFSYLSSSNSEISLSVDKRYSLNAYLEAKQIHAWDCPEEEVNWSIGDRLSILNNRSYLIDQLFLPFRFFLLWSFLLNNIFYSFDKTSWVCWEGTSVMICVKSSCLIGIHDSVTWLLIMLYIIEFAYHVGKKNSFRNKQYEDSWNTKYCIINSTKSTKHVQKWLNTSINLWISLTQS